MTTTVAAAADPSLPPCHKSEMLTESTRFAENSVLSLSIWDLWQGGRLGSAAAATVVVMAFQFAFLLLLLLKLGPRFGYAESLPTAPQGQASSETSGTR